VALDWARVLDVAYANACKAGVSERYERLPGSAFDVDFGGPYDAVLLTNFLHHCDVPTGAGLLKKVRGALKPGGVSATLEFRTQRRPDLTAHGGGVQPHHADLDSCRRRLHFPRTGGDAQGGGLRRDPGTPRGPQPAHGGHRHRGVSGDVRAALGWTSREAYPTALTSLRD
jgi:hypothetical protein